MGIEHRGAVNTAARSQGPARLVEVSTFAASSIMNRERAGRARWPLWAASLLCWLFAGSARAEYPGSFPVRLSGGLVGGLGGGEAGTMAAGRAMLRGGRFALEGAAREGWYFTPSRSVGALFLGARYLPNGPAFARVGLAHHHEVPQAAFLAAPGGAIAGTAEGINHRSGFEAGVGLWAPVPTPVWDGRMGLLIDLSAELLPDDKGPMRYVALEVGMYLDVGKPR